MPPAECISRGLTVAKRQCGAYMNFLLLQPTVIFVDNDEAVKDVLSARVTIQRSVRSLGKQLPVWDRLFGKGLFMASPTDWKRTHRIAMRGFGPKQIAGFVPLVQRQIEEQFRSLQAAVGRGAPEKQLGLEALSEGVVVLDSAAFFKDLAMRVILTVAFGQDVDADDGATLLRSMSIFEDASEHPAFLFHRYLDAPLSKPRELRKAIRDLHAIAHSFIDKERAISPNGRNREGTLLGALLHARDDEGGSLSEEDLVHNVYSFIAAGISTTSHTLTTIGFLLAKHKGVQQKLQAELEGVTGWEDLKDKVYVGAVITEAMRLWPSVIGLPSRAFTEETTIGGIRFPEGSRVGVNSAATQRRVHIWGPDAAEFRPERFLEGNAAAKTQNPMMPSLLPEGVPETAFTAFGGGVRPCIGRPLAMVEMKLALLHLVQRFSLSEDPEKLFEMKHALPFLKSKPGLRLLLRPRGAAGA